MPHHVHIAAARRPGTSRAFTLVELLVVISILGIVFAVAIPTLHRRLNPDSMDKAVKDILDACHHARAYAILQSVPVDLVISGEDGAISLQPSGGAQTRAASEDELAPPPDPDFAPVESEAPRSTSALAGETLNFTAKLSGMVAVELIEVNFMDQLELTEARVRFYPNGTSDEFKMLLWHAESGERRLISLEVVTALADVESDPKKFR